MDVEATYAQFLAQGIGELIERLVALRGTAEEPVVEILLHSGRSYTGVPLRGERSATLLLKIAEDPRDRVRATELVYVAIASIEAVRVLDPMRIRDVLSNGAVTVEHMLDEPELTRLAARRQVKEEWDALNFTPPIELEVEWDSLPDRPFTNNIVARAARSLGAYLRGLSGDEIGRASLASLTSVRIQFHAGDLAVARSGGVLTLSTKLDPKELNPDSLAKKADQIF